MASGKQHKGSEKIIQLELFPDDLPAPDKEEQAPPVPPLKPVRTRKPARAAPPEEIAAPTESVEQPASVVSTSPEASSIPEELAKKQETEREEELKVKFKKNQEARLAALRRARGLK